AARNAVRETDAFGRSLLHLAASDHGRLPFLKALLRHPGAELLQQDAESGWTPLHRALYHGNISAAREIVRCARKRGIGWDGLLKKDRGGDTPLELFLATVGGYNVNPSLKAKQEPVGGDLSDTDESDAESD